MKIDNYRVWAITTEEGNKYEVHNFNGSNMYQVYSVVSFRREIDVFTYYGAKGSDEEQSIIKEHINDME